MTNWNPEIFREYDIRGIAERDLSEAFASRLGRVYAAYLREKIGGAPLARALTVGVGRDCRLTSEPLASALAEGLRDAGIAVVRLGICPTPLTHFSIYHLGLDGGIMVTGSHNPSEYNGFKIAVGRDTLHGPEIQTLRERMEAADNFVSEKFANLTDWDPIPAYIDYVVANAKPLRRKKIVLDAGNGTASTVAPELFRRLGADVIPLFCELDGKFPNHHPDPTVAKNLQHLIARVREESADFGVAFDGDSDRIGLVDEQGKILYGDEILLLLAREVLASHPGATIIGDVKSSNRLYSDIRKRGGTALLWKTGHSLIKSKMKETGALLAGELSGHIFFADRYLGYDDALYAATRVYEIASASCGAVSSLLSDLEPCLNTPEIRIPCEESKKFALVEETKNLLVSQNRGIVNDIDGIRVEVGEAWGLVRASNTQPVIVLRFEAKTDRELSEIRAWVEKALEESAVKLGHPPLNPQVEYA